MFMAFVCDLLKKVSFVQFLFSYLSLSLSLSLFWIVKDGIFLNNRDKRINSFLQLSEAGLVI